MDIRSCLKTLKSSLRRLNSPDMLANESNSIELQESVKRITTTIAALVLLMVQKLGLIYHEIPLDLHLVDNYNKISCSTANNVIS